MLRCDGQIIGDSLIVNNIFSANNQGTQCLTNLNIAGETTANNITNTGTINNTGNITNTGTITNNGNITNTGTLTSNDNVVLGNSNNSTLNVNSSSLFNFPSIFQANIFTVEPTVKVLSIQNGTTQTAYFQADGTLINSAINCNSAVFNNVNINNNTVIDSLGNITASTLKLTSPNLNTLTVEGSASINGGLNLWGNLNVVGTNTCNATTINGLLTANAGFILNGLTPSEINVTTSYTGAITDPNHLVNKNYIDNLEIGLIWVPPVLDLVDTLPNNPSNGDRYIYTGSTTADYTQNDIYEWNATDSVWVATETKIGLTTLNETNKNTYSYILDYENNPSWQMIGIGGTNDHKALINIGVNTHTQIDDHISNSSTAHFGQDLTTLGNPIFSGLTTGTLTSNQIIINNSGNNKALNILLNSISTANITGSGFYSGTGANFNGELTAQNLNISTDNTVYASISSNGTLTAVSGIITGSTASTSANTGAFVVNGGIGVGGNSIISGTLQLMSLSNSALTVSGGTQLNNTLNVEGETNLSGSLNANSTSTFNDLITLNANNNQTYIMQVNNEDSLIGYWNNDGVLYSNKMQCPTAPESANDVVRLQDLGNSLPQSTTFNYSFGDAGSTLLYDHNGDSILNFNSGVAVNFKISIQQINHLILFQMTLLSIPSFFIIPLNAVQIKNQTPISTDLLPVNNLQTTLTFNYGVKESVLCNLNLSPEGFLTFNLLTSINPNNPSIQYQNGTGIVQLQIPSTITLIGFN